MHVSILRFSNGVRLDWHEGEETKASTQIGTELYASPSRNRGTSSSTLKSVMQSLGAIYWLATSGRDIDTFCLIFIPSTSWFPYRRNRKVNNPSKQGWIEGPQWGWSGSKRGDLMEMGWADIQNTWSNRQHSGLWSKYWIPWSAETFLSLNKK